MKHGITAVLAAAALAAAASAQATDNEAGFYAGAGVGTSTSRSTTSMTSMTRGRALRQRRHGVESLRRLAHEPISRVRARVRKPRQPQRRDPSCSDLTTETDGFAPYVVGTLPSATGSSCSRRSATTGTTRNVSDHAPRHRERLGKRRDLHVECGRGSQRLRAMNFRLEYEQFDFDEADTSSPVADRRIPLLIP